MTLQKLIFAPAKAKLTFRIGVLKKYEIFEKQDSQFPIKDQIIHITINRQAVNTVRKLSLRRKHCAYGSKFYQMQNAITQFF